MTATMWPGHTARRPAAYIDQPTQPAITVTPAPTQGPAPQGGEPWTWTPIDLLLIPVALLLADGPGRHRRGPDTVTRRGTSYRRRTSDFEWSFQDGPR